MKVKVEPYAVSIVPLSEQTDVLVTPEFRVPPNFISNTTTGGVGGSALNRGGDLGRRAAAAAPDATTYRRGQRSPSSARTPRPSSKPAA